jgi:hypothetical protein
MSIYKETVTLPAGQLVTDSRSVAPGYGLVRVSAPGMTGTPTFSIQGSVDEGVTNLDNYVKDTLVTYNLAATARTISLDPENTKGLDTLRLKVSAVEASVKTFELVFSN